MNVDFDCPENKPPVIIVFCRLKINRKVTFLKKNTRMAGGKEMAQRHTFHFPFNLPQAQTFALTASIIIAFLRWFSIEIA